MPLWLFKQLFAYFTIVLETYVHPGALAVAIIKGGAAQQLYAPMDIM